MRYKIILVVLITTLMIASVFGNIGIAVIDNGYKLSYNVLYDDVDLKEDNKIKTSWNVTGEPLRNNYNLGGYIYTTDTFYSQNYDGELMGYGYDYNTVHNAYYANILDDNYGGTRAGQVWNAFFIYIFRTYLYFDTSSLPDNAIINSAKLYWEEYAEPEGDSGVLYFMWDSSGNHPTIPLSMGDYYYDYYETCVAISSDYSHGWHNVFLSANSIVKDGWTNYCVRGQWDYDSVPTDGYRWIHTSESSYCPYLEITYSIPNQPPNTPSNPSPSNGATGVSINADLSWTGGDPNPGDTVTYDVYFGTSSNPPLVASGISLTTYDPGTINYNTKYYWQIIAWDNHGASTTGPIWDFTTKIFQSPILTYSPSSIDFGTHEAGWTGDDSFEVWNSGGGTLTYTITESINWLMISPTSGSSTGEHDTITVNVVNTGSMNGYYNGTISISSNDGSGSVFVEIEIQPVPEAEAGGPYTGYLTDHTIFMGSASAGTSPYTYAWDLDNDGSYDDATGYLAARTWTSTGTFTIGLRVTDQAGQTDTDTAQVTVVSTQAPYTYVVPGYSSGSHDTRIDIVFIIDEDYNIDIVDFLMDLRDQIHGTYEHMFPINTNIDSFNFWYTEWEGDAESTYNDHILPNNFTDNCAWAETAAILHRENFGDWTEYRGTLAILSGEGNFPGTNVYTSLIHETGHGVFGVADEYRDDPPGCTHYFQPNPYPNIFDSQQGAQNHNNTLANESWNTSTLRVVHFCDPAVSTCCQNTVGNGWWKLCPDNLCIMDSATPDDGFGVACQARIQHICDNAVAEFDNWSLEIQLEWNENYSSFIVLETRILDSFAPNNLQRFAAAEGEIYSFYEEDLYEFNVSRPLKFYERDYCDCGKSPYFENNYLTTIIIPYYYNAENVSFYDSFTGQFITSVNVSEYATGNIKGSITDYIGNPVVNATIELIGTNIYTGESDQSGEYTIVHIIPGDYTIVVTPPHSSSLMPASSSVLITAGENITSDFSLHPQLNQAFLCGIIDEKNESDEYISFKAGVLLYINLLTFEFYFLYEDNEPILISKEYVGYIGSQFIIGLFHAAVLSEATSSASHPFRNRIKRYVSAG